MFDDIFMQFLSVFFLLIIKNYYISNYKSYLFPNVIFINLKHECLIRLVLDYVFINYMNVRELM